MLSLLNIKNLALVDQLLWEPRSGFTCITGETGAGKSVIIGGIKLALGERADKSLIRTGTDTCSIEAVFHLPDDSAIPAMLDERGIPACEDGNLILRRQISTTGTRQFLNDAPCTLNLLKEIGSLLVDMHGPDEHRSLTRPERQLSLLDSFADAGNLFRTYTATRRELLDARAAYDELANARAASDREMELLRHQVEEIEAAELTREEVASLDERWQRANNASRLRELAGRMLDMIDASEGPSLNEGLHELTKCSRELERMDSSVEGMTEPLDLFHVELNELSRTLSHYLDSLEVDEEEVARLEERINIYETLKRKYGATYDDIAMFYDDARKRLDNVEHRSERLDEMREAIAKLEGRLAADAKALTKVRTKAAPRLADEVTRHTRELGFRQAIFEVSLPHADPGAVSGAEYVELLFSPNPGEPPKPLRQIASSGELARVMLALKSALADKDFTPLLIFDEIDANVGGEIAKAVGLKMRRLGTRHQVLAITHFPQVAALAQSHFLVTKSVKDKRSLTSLTEVTGDARVAEIVRMLGGGGPEARNLAVSLLADAPAS